MPDPDLFARLGLFVRRGVLSPAACGAIRAELATARRTPTPIHAGADFRVDEEIRSTKGVHVSERTRSLVEGLLDQLRPELAAHFAVPLAGHQRAQFLVYEEGDFFRAHTDNSDADDAADEVRQRRVSVVLFLATEQAGGPADTYAGGSLRLYGLIDDPLWKTCGLPVAGEEGLLVAFRSDVPHEVTPVTRGERYTVVSWFV